MVKKNLFVLFNFYFFVVQLILIGFLWGDYRFFYLALINFLFIFIISLFFKNTQKEESATTKIDEKLESKEKSVPDIVHKIHYIQKPKDKKGIHHFWFFVISVLFGFFIWFWLPELEIHTKLFIAIFSSFLLYVIFAGLFKIKSFKTWESYLFLTILLALVIGSLFTYFNINIFSNSEETTISDNQIEKTFVSVDEDIEDTTAQTIVEPIEKITLDDVDLEHNANFRDVIRFLIDKNQIKLQEAQNISFNYIPYSDTDYLYFRTAYSLGMIGKNLNPEKFPLCETYVVMVGLAQNWNVQKSADIKQTYWSYAKINGLLPSCKYGEVVKFKDLK